MNFIDWLELAKERINMCLYRDNTPHDSFLKDSIKFMNEAQELIKEEYKLIVCEYCYHKMIKGAIDSYGYVRYYCSCGNKKEILI